MTSCAGLQHEPPPVGGDINNAADVAMSPIVLRRSSDRPITTCSSKTLEVIHSAKTENTNSCSRELPMTILTFGQKLYLCYEKLNHQEA